MHISGINLVADVTSRLGIDSTCKICEEVLQCLHKNDHIQDKHVHLNRVLPQSLQDSTVFNCGELECVANISEAIHELSSLYCQKLLITKMMMPPYFSFITVLINTIL